MSEPVGKGSGLTIGLALTVVTAVGGGSAFVTQALTSLVKSTDSLEKAVVIFDARLDTLEGSDGPHLLKTEFSSWANLLRVMNKDTGLEVPD